MNKRIQKMIAERGMFQDSELYELAEAVIRECANRATWAQDTGAADIGGEVLKHFGVEE